MALPWVNETELFPSGRQVASQYRTAIGRQCGVTDSYTEPIVDSEIHAGALVLSKETPPSPLRSTVQIIFVPLANATRYLPPRLFESVVSSSKVSDSSVPLEPNVRRPNSRRN